MAIYRIIGSIFGGAERIRFVNVPDGADVNECVKAFVKKEDKRVSKLFPGRHFHFYGIDGVVAEDDFSGYHNPPKEFPE